MKKQTPKLPKEFKKKWVAALRSGKYKQGEYNLYDSHNNNSYCCLGVACKVAGIRNSRIDQIATIPVGMKDIPEMLQGASEDNKLVEKLTTWNDGNLFQPRRSFKWIASYIERYL